MIDGINTNAGAGANGRIGLSPGNDLGRRTVGQQHGTHRVGRLRCRIQSADRNRDCREFKEVFRAR